MIWVRCTAWAAASLVALTPTLQGCGRASAAKLVAAPVQLHGPASAPEVLAVSGPEGPAVAAQVALEVVTPGAAQEAVAGPRALAADGGGIGDLARAALASHPALSIVLRDGLEVRPLAGSRLGLVFYPGGNVDPRAYAPLARAWALAGYTVCVPAMPFQKAIFAPNKATEVVGRHPGVTRWVVGGHSLGGVTASMYAAWHPKRVAGLMLLAAVPGPGADLSRRVLPTLSLYGVNDPRVTLAEIGASARKLPHATRFVGLVGANHGQFGDYGPHPGDAPAEISREEQHARVVAATVAWLAEALPR